MADDDDVPQAARIACGICSFCNGVHVNLIEDAGDVFATAVVGIEIGEAFIADFRTCLQRVRERPHPAPARRQ